MGRKKPSTDSRPDKTQRTLDNRRHRLQRHLRRFPNDSVAKRALDNLQPRRKKPPVQRNINKIYRSPYPFSTLKFKFNFRPRSFVETIPSES